jgi:hypothetical protein
VTDVRAYGSPTAFRRALTDRLKENARTGRWTLPQLQRQFAYDRLLERLYLVDDGWVFKGAIALLARGIGVRATVDIDVYRRLLGRLLRQHSARPRTEISAIGSTSRSVPAVRWMTARGGSAYRSPHTWGRQYGWRSTSTLSVPICA